LISLVAALLIGLGILLSTRRPVPQRRGKTAIVVLAACYLAFAIALLLSLTLPNGAMHATDQVNANLEGSVELLAYVAGGGAYHPGDTVSVTLYWRALRTLGQDYKAFVHLTDAEVTRQPAQHDGDPGGGFTPTTRWLPGEIVPDTHHLQLPADLEPGHYRLWAGMYEHEIVRNLTILSADTPAADGRVMLGEIEVSSP
jgi:hypothetical protein